MSRPQNPKIPNRKDVKTRKTLAEAVDQIKTDRKEEAAERRARIVKSSYKDAEDAVMDMIYGPNRT